LKLSLSSRFLLFLAAAWIIGGTMILAQTFVGGVRGLVQDPDGAVIANANVTLTNEGTGATRSTVTNTQGEYVFTQLLPATYSISVEVQGFKKLQRPGVIVGTQETVNVDVKMEIGQVTESVQVTTDVPLIENTNASNGQVLDSQKMTDLPNLGRNPFLLSTLSSGVIATGDPRFNRFEDQSGESAISVAGGPIRGNNYLIDGISIASSSNQAVIIPSLEAVQEMNLQANTYDASMGRTGGGVFNTILKTGTNTFHGDVFGYLRDTAWSANNFFRNASGSPRLPNDWKNWGGGVGGPVIIPKVYNGTNKTFFYASTESYRQHSSESDKYAVPTALERMGNYSQSTVTIYDPLSTRPCGSGDNCPAGVSSIRNPFQGNTIPIGQINPVGSAIENIAFPLPQTSGPTDSFNYIGSSALFDRAYEYIFKGEQYVTSWLRLSASFMRYGSVEPGGNTLGTPPASSTAAGGSFLLHRDVDATGVNAIMTPNNTTVVTVRYGFNRFPAVTLPDSTGFNLPSLGLPAGYISAIQKDYFPYINMVNDFISPTAPSQTVSYSKNANGSVSKFIGRHSITLGLDYRLIDAEGISWTDAAGHYTFSGVFSREFPQTANGTGADFADLLMGYPSSGQLQTSTQLNDFVRYYGGYFQDDIRVSKKLTVNAGIRYEFQTGVMERNNALAVGFNRTQVNPIAAGVTGVVPYGVLEFAGQNGNPTQCCNLSKTQFGPRIGMAYQLNARTTLRGGYGIFDVPFSFGTGSAPGYTQVTTYVASNNGNQTPANSLSNPFPSGILQPAGNTLAAFTGIGSALSVYDQNESSGIVQQFSADLQRELGYGIALEVGYVGSRSSRLLGGATLLINQLPVQYLSLGSGLNTAVANPFFGNPGAAGVIGNATVARAQLLLPFPEYGAISSITNSASAQYDSMVVKAQKRLTRGLTFLSTFTWSKNMDSSYGTAGTSAFNTFSGSTPPSQPQNAYNLGAEWALAAADIPLRWTGSWTYQLPFGKGKQFLNSSKMLDYALGGWSINGIAIIQNGSPLFVYQQNLNSVIGTGEQRPNATGVSPNTNLTPEQGVTQSYINPAAFSQAPAFTFGNVSRDIPYFGPGQANWDMSLFKVFQIKERFTAQFRAEALNAFNTPLFANPNTQFIPGSQTFGKITYQANYPREIQLGLRFYF